MDSSFLEKTKDSLKALISYGLINCEKCGNRLEKIREDNYSNFLLEIFECSNPVCEFKVCVTNSKNKKKN